MLTATLKDGNIQDLNYFDAVKTDAYPVVQMKKDEKILKGFDWLSAAATILRLSAILAASALRSASSLLRSALRTRFKESCLASIL